jgi:hypothetical protein
VFSAPLWLSGLIVLVIPLVLHLWSRRPRQVIRVGTLRHIGLTADARSWSARLTDPLLLAVRLVLLATIVLALAGLRLPVRRSAGSSGILVLVDRALLDSPASVPFLDSLHREHEPVRLLEGGLPRVQLGARPDESPATRNSGSTTDIWTALAEADALVEAGGTIHVVARPRLEALRGSRPRVRARIVWHTPAADDPAQWDLAAWRKGDSTLRVTAAGGRAGTRRALSRSTAPCDGCVSPAPYRVWVDAGRDSAAKHRIGVALGAIAEELGLAVDVTSSADSAGLVLSTQPLSDTLLLPGRTLILLTDETVRGSTLADSIWAQWPTPLAADDRDRREVSAAQALASRPVNAPAPLGDPESTRQGLLLLALLLFGIERWLATRPGRREV